MTTKIIQINEIDSKELFARFESLENAIKELREAQTSKPSKPIFDENLMTRQQVADTFKITIMTAIIWTRQGVLKAYKIGNRVFYKRNEIEAALIKMQSVKG